MFFSRIGPVKKFKPVDHKNHRWNKDQCNHERHYISEKSKFEIGKIESGLQQIIVVVHWFRSLLGYRIGYVKIKRI